jgi:predicted nucleotidyltransferase
MARELGLDPGGMTREADRLEQAGLIVSQRIGRQRLLGPNRESPYYAPLHALLMRAFGPAAIIGPALKSIAGIDEAIILGSWAARYLGEAGHDPADIDLLVVGFPDRREINRAARGLSQQLMREVNITLVSPERWHTPGDGFLRQVKRGPQVPIDLAVNGS